MQREKQPARGASGTGEVGGEALDLGDAGEEDEDRTTILGPTAASATSTSARLLSLVSIVIQFTQQHGNQISGHAASRDALQSRLCALAVPALQHRPSVARSSIALLRRRLRHHCAELLLGRLPSQQHLAPRHVATRLDRVLEEKVLNRKGATGDVEATSTHWAVVTTTTLATLAAPSTLATLAAHCTRAHASPAPAAVASKILDEAIGVDGGRHQHDL